MSKFVTKGKASFVLAILIAAGVIFGLHIKSTTATLEVKAPTVVKLDSLDVLDKPDTLGDLDKEAQVVTREPSRLEKICELARTDHVALLEMALEEYNARGDNDYSCTFVKQENIRGKLSKEQEIAVKFLGQPFSVAMEWKKNAPTGDKLVFVDGKYADNKGRSQMVVRPKSGFLQGLTGGSVLRLPDCNDAMKNTLKPCTEFGFANALKNLVDVYKLARGRGECEEKFEGFAEINGRKCLVLWRGLMYRKDYPAKITQVFLDIETLLPLEVIGYDWKDKLACNYEYRDVDFEAEFSEKDFTPSANGIKGH